MFDIVGLMNVKQKGEKGLRVVYTADLQPRIPKG